MITSDNRYCLSAVWGPRLSRTNVSDSERTVKEIVPLVSRTISLLLQQYIASAVWGSDIVSWFQSTFLAKGMTSVIVLWSDCYGYMELENQL